MNVLLTGASGFLGRRLAVYLDQRAGFSLTCAVRRHSFCCCDQSVLVGSLDGNTDWSAALAGQQVVIHAAARAHVMEDELLDPLAEYRKVNVEGTLKLARQASDAGVKRFIYISSIKVNGEQTFEGSPFRADDSPAAIDPYGISKMEAEQGLQRLSEESGLEVVIIRPPLIYGPGVKGNFASMVRLVEKGFPLPLGAVHNKRTLVAVDNLVDLIATCIDHPAAANQVFLAGDGEDLSTTELLLIVAKSLDKKARLIPVPGRLLMFGATLLGRKSAAQRLLSSLQVDVSKAHDLLGWQPPLGVAEGMRRCFAKDESPVSS